MPENIHNNIKGYFDNWTWAKGKRYFEEGRVGRFSEENCEAQAKVKGSGKKEYTATIYFNADKTRLKDSDCTCPMVLDCKHTAALALAYLKKEETAEPASLKAGSTKLKIVEKPSAGKTASRKADTAKVQTTRKVVTVRAQTTRKQDRKPQSKILALSLAESDSEQAYPHQENMRHHSKHDNTSLPAAPIRQDALQLAPLRKSAMEALYTISQAASGNAANTPLDSLHSSHSSTLVYRLSDSVGGLVVQLFKAWPTAPTNPTEVSPEDRPIPQGQFSNFEEVDCYELIESEFLPRFVPHQDYKLLQLLDKTLKMHSYLAFRQIDATDPELFDLTLRRLIETGRCYWNNFFDGPLSYGPPLELIPQWEFENNRYGIILADREAKPSKLRPLNLPFPYYICNSNNAIGKCQSQLSADVMAALAKLPQFNKDELLAFLVSAAQRRVLHCLPPAPPECQFDVRLIAPRATLETKQIKTNGTLMIGRKYISRNEELDIFLAEIGQEAESRLIRDEAGKLILELNDDFKPSAINALISAGFEPVPKARLQLSRQDKHKMAFMGPGTSRLLDMATDNFKLLTDVGWQISEASLASLLPQPFTENNLTVGLTEDSEWWFTLELKLTIDGKEHNLLPIMFAALDVLRKSKPEYRYSLSDEAIESLNRRGFFIAELSNGKYISLPFDRARAILYALRDVSEHESMGPSIPVHRVKDMLNYEGLAMARWFGADRVRSLIERLKNLLNPQPAGPPQNFQATLRPYQLEGIQWMQNLAANKFGGVLADDMGLGKTIQLLAHIALEKEAGRLTEPFLVVCPTTVLPNWLSEARKFAPHLKVAAYAGTDRKQMFHRLPGYDIVVTTYPVIFRDQDLQDLSWHGMALDEAQAIKTPHTKLSQIVCKFKANQRFCMTGTPIENNLSELWSLFRFILPGLLGSKTYFSKYVRSPIEKHGDTALKEELARRVEPFMLRRTKAQVLKDLPPKTTIIKTVELQGNQRDIYETVRLATYDRVRKEIEARGFRMSQIIILDALLKLRQTCCDPQLVKIEAVQKVKESAKREVLFEMLDEIVAEGRKVLVFSQFTSFLDIVIDHLNNCGIPFVQIRGSTTDRVTPVKEFQEGDTQIFLLSLKAGGTGLNLTAADTVIHYDPWWNPAVEDQATDRAHRIGQDKPVFVYKLIAQGTIEERMMELQERKRNLALGIVDKADGRSEAFTEADLERLLEPLAALD